MKREVNPDGLVDMLAADNNNMRRAGLSLAEAALHVIREYDGLHRLSIAVAEWASVIANEGGRPHDGPKVAEPEQPKPKFRAEPDRAEQPKYDYHADWTRDPDDGYCVCNYCGKVEYQLPTAPHDHAECRARTRKQPSPSEPVIDREVILDFWDGPLSRDDFVRAVRGIESIIREATAAAKPVTISERDLSEWFGNPQNRFNDLLNLLRRRGVEVVP